MSGLKVFLNGAAFWTFFIGLTGTVHAELILYYSFEDSVSAGGTVVNLVNPGVYNGTLQDGAYTNGVLNLDGSGDFLQTALPTNNLGAPVTFSFWMKASDTSSLGRAIISGYTDHINRWDIQLSRDGDQKVRFIHHEGDCGPVSNTSISTNTWYHVAVVHNSNTDKVDLYVNGILETSALIGSSLNLCTGINMRVGQGDRNNFWGQIDDVAIWNNEALSSGQIRGIAQQAAVAIADGDWSAPETWFRSAQGTGTWQRLPDSGVDAVIAGGRTVTISSGTAAAKNLVMGAAGETATVRLAGGTLNLAGNIQGTGVDITFNFHSGTLNLGGSSIGLDHFLLGTDPGANAQFTLDSGKSLTTGTLAVGGQGTGVFNFTGSGLSANKVTLGPGGTITCTGTGLAWTFSKSLEITGGLLQIPSGALVLDGGGTGTLSDGEIRLLYGYVGYANSPLTTFSQTGGTFSVQSDLAVGRQSAAQGLYTLVDGLLEVGTKSRSDPALRVGRAATGTFTQQGGTVRIPYGGLSLGEEGGNGTYNLQGGVLITPSITRGTGTGVFNWTGGTLHVDTFGTAATPFNLSQQGGVLAPGQSIGSTTIRGDYTQAAPGILEIEIASLTSFDKVTVYGNAELHGQILVSLLGGYVPAVGQRFPILSTTGSLDISGLSVGNMQPVAIGWVLELAAGQGGGQVLLLQAVPEPTSGILGLLALAGLGLVLLGRSRNRCRA